MSSDKQPTRVELTPWFSDALKPVRSGVYRMANSSKPSGWAYGRWDMLMQKWCPYKSWGFYASGFFWRGLTGPTEDERWEP